MSTTNQPITDVSRRMWQLVWLNRGEIVRRYWLRAILWEAAAAGVYVTVAGRDAVSPLLITTVAILGWAVVDWTRRQQPGVQALFLRQFADRNGLSFSPDAAVDETGSTIFALPGQQTTSDMITGRIGQCDLKFYLFTKVHHDPGTSQRYDTVYRISVLELVPGGRLGRALVINNNQDFGPLDYLIKYFGQADEVKLEGDFSRFFRVLVPTGGAVDALEVFDPPTMELMERGNRHYSVELAEDRAYIYMGGYAMSRWELEPIFALARQLAPRLGPLSERMQAGAEADAKREKHS